MQATSTGLRMAAAGPQLPAEQQGATASLGQSSVPMVQGGQASNAPPLHHALRRELARRVAAPTVRELDALADTSRDLQPLWRSRRALFERHVDALTCGQLMLWGLRQGVDRLLFLRGPLTRTMFPIATMTFNNAVARGEDFTGDQPPGRAPGSFGLTPVGLVTEDHALLDGMFVTSNRAGPKGQHWPTVVFVPPNGMTYEEMLVPACLFAEKYRADVLLFNYRGVGKSLGRLQSIEDAVVDTATFLAHACAHSASVGILGLSMGGGTAAAAVARLHRAGTLPEGAPSLFVAVHTFSSWFDVARGRFGPMWAHTFFGLARVLGMHDLETSAYLQNHRLAQRTLVAEASTDGVLPAAARLGNQPLPPEHAQVFWDAGARHGDLGFLAFDGARLSPPGAPSIRAQLHLWRVDVDAPPSGGTTASRL